MSVNKQIILGRLGKDPDLREAGETKVCNFSVATSYKRSGGDEDVTWHNIVAWGRTAEVMAQYLKKGDEVYIEGRTVHETYEKDGQTKNVTKVVVNNFSFVSGRRGESAANTGDTSGPSNGNDDDLPF